MDEEDEDLDPPGRFCGEAVLHDFLFGLVIGWIFFAPKALKKRYMRGRPNLKVKDFYMNKSKMWGRPIRFARWIAGIGASSCVPTIINGGEVTSLSQRHLFYFWWGFFMEKRRFGSKAIFPTDPLVERFTMGARWWLFMFVIETVFYVLLAGLEPEPYPMIHNMWPHGSMDDTDEDYPDYNILEEFDEFAELPYRFQRYGSTLVPGVNRNYITDSSDLIAKFKRMQLYHLPQFDTKGSIPEPFDPNRPKHLLSQFNKWRYNEVDLARKQAVHDLHTLVEAAEDPGYVSYMYHRIIPKEVYDLQRDLYKEEVEEHEEMQRKMQREQEEQAKGYRRPLRAK